jgi:hypothetical protein
MQINGSLHFFPFRHCPLNVPGAGSSGPSAVSLSVDASGWCSLTGDFRKLVSVAQALLYQFT